MGRFQGVSFARALRDAYPTAFHEVERDRPDIHSTVPPCDVLMIDLLQVVSALFHYPESVDNVTHRFTPFFFSRIRDLLIETVKLMRPRKLLYIALDGQAPFAKMDETRRRIFERMSHKTDVTTSFVDDNPEDPNGETLQYRQLIHEALSTVPEWSHLSVVFDCSFNPGEAEHKFLAYVRFERLAKTFSPDLNYAIFALDAELISIVLLLHIPNITIIRHPHFGPVLEIVDIRHLRIAIAQDYGNNERYIDDFVAMGMLVGTDYMPGLARFNVITEAYRGVGTGFLVENGDLNRDFLEQFLLILESRQEQNNPG
jgi:5'-3' exoribonuclease 1